MFEVIKAVSEKKGIPVESFKQVEAEDLEEIKEEFNDSQEIKIVFEDSDHFTKRSCILSQGLVPIKTAMNRTTFDI